MSEKIVNCKFCGPHAPGKDGCSGWPNFDDDAEARYQACGECGHVAPVPAGETGLWPSACADCGASWARQYTYATRELAEYSLPRQRFLSAIA